MLRPHTTPASTLLTGHPAGSPAEAVSWSGFFATTNLGLVILGADLAVLSLNPAAERLTGWPATEAVGQDGRVVVVIRSPRHLRLRGLLNRVQAGQSYPCHGEPGQIARLITRDKSECSVSLQILAAQPDAPILLVLQEVPHRRLNPQCARNFLAAAGHELRTPLTALRGFADVLIARPDLPVETRTEFHRILGEEVSRLTALVDRVLEVSRLEVGAVLPKPGPVAPGALLTTILQRHQRGIDQRQITLDCQIAADVPDVWADQPRLVRIIEELLLNALHHTPARGRIEVRLEVVEEHLCLSFRDSGPGLPAGEEAHVFDPFHRGKTKHKGAGIGLSLVRGNVQLMGGTVTAANVPQGGAYFEVRLPLEDLRPQ